MVAVMVAAGTVVAMAEEITGAISAMMVVTLGVTAFGGRGLGGRGFGRGGYGFGGGYAYGLRRCPVPFRFIAGRCRRF